MISFKKQKPRWTVGRLEARDWIDVITGDERIQPLGYLAWAVSGKDPAFGPAAILEHAARSACYSKDEIGQLAFDGETPDATLLAQRWHRILEEARDIVAALRAAYAGRYPSFGDRERASVFRRNRTELCVIGR